MEDEQMLMAQLAMFSSGAGKWIEQAQEQDFDGEAVSHVEEAREHVREAMEILDEKE